MTPTMLRNSVVSHRVMAKEICEESGREHVLSSNPLNQI